MRNGKTHFITGAIVGATVNLTIQIAQMAMDYDRPFDWSEFFLCTGAGAFAAAAPDILESLPLPIRWGEGQGEGTFVGPSEVDRRPNHRQFFHSLLSAALIAWAISGKRTLKLSRPTRLALWAFGISNLSQIALDSTKSKPINLI